MFMLKWGDKVRVIQGFYKGLEGIAVHGSSEVWENGKIIGYDSYLIELDLTPYQSKIIDFSIGVLDKIEV